MSVGVPTLDEQHKKWLQLLNELWSAMKKGRASSVTDRVLEEVVNYTSTHFADEEALLRLYKYPNYANHKAEHDAFTARIQRMQRDHLAGRIIITIELVTSMREWVLGHIASRDGDYGAFVRDAHGAHS